jgi:[ribosomal protein S18]-alanine N-acetyltransferase
LPVNFLLKNNIKSITVDFSFAAAADIDAILSIENQSFQSPWTRQHFQGEFNQPHSFTLLARRVDITPSEIAGYIVYWFLIDELHILNLAVSPQYRRLGLARSLLLETIQRAQAIHIKTAWLEVRPSNEAAISLYHSFEFELVITRKRYYSDTGEDALILSRPI